MDVGHCRIGSQECLEPSRIGAKAGGDNPARPTGTDESILAEFLGGRRPIADSDRSTLPIVGSCLCRRALVFLGLVRVATRTWRSAILGQCSWLGFADDHRYRLVHYPGPDTCCVLDRRHTVPSAAVDG
jgi:hypothetical protein